jgi:hypothetical protein
MIPVGHGQSFGFRFDALSRVEPSVSLDLTDMRLQRPVRLHQDAHDLGAALVERKTQLRRFAILGRGQREGRQVRPAQPLHRP